MQLLLLYVNDPRQHFAFITDDGGETYYLYHPAEKKYVNKSEYLTDKAEDPIYLKDGKYENTFIAYFDDNHYINVNEHDHLVIDGWNTPDEGNSCSIIPVEKTTTAVDNVKAETNKAQKVIEDSRLLIILPDGTTYSTLGERIK